MAVLGLPALNVEPVSSHEELPDLEALLLEEFGVDDVGVRVPGQVRRAEVVGLGGGRGAEVGGAQDARDRGAVHEPFEGDVLGLGEAARGCDNERGML